MKEFLKNGKLTEVDLVQQQKIREEIKKRWDVLGFREGLKGQMNPEIAKLYESNVNLFDDDCSKFRNAYKYYETTN